MPSSFLRLMADDHGRADRLLARAAAPGPSRDRWRAEAVALLLAHRSAEDAMWEAVEAAEPGFAGGIEQARTHTASLESVCAAALAATDDDLGDAVRLARAWLRNHVLLTDTALAPAMQQTVRRRLLRELGGRYVQLRDDGLRRAGTAREIPRRLDLSRAELYELAKKAGIEGRSAMTREQLIEALTATATPDGQAAPSARPRASEANR